MSFIKHTYEDRVSEHPTRRTITDASTSEQVTVDVERMDGTVYSNPETHLIYDAEHMQDIEDRIEAGFEAIQNKLAQRVDLFYPVGSIYISADNTSPANIFGGTWESITGGVLLPATNCNLTPQGSDTATFTPSGSVEFSGSVANGYAEVPYHRHLTVKTILKVSSDVQDFARPSGAYEWRIRNRTLTTDAKGGGQPHGHGFSGSGSFSVSSAQRLTWDNRMASLTVYAWRRTA